nr:carbohydrate kinase [uncultured Draconibacterium sp.]
MSNKLKVVGIGEVLWDMLPQGKVLGGAPANFVFHSSQLGAEGYVISAIGNDDLGKEIVKSLSEHDLNLHLQKVDHPTSTVKVTLDEKGVPNFEICENVAWDYLELKQEDKLLAVQTDAVCFGSLAMRNKPSKNTIMDFVKSVPSSALKVFDINLRQHFYTKELIKESLQLSNVLKINDDELKIVENLFGYSGSEEKVCHAILNDYNLHYVVLTKGANGSVVVSPEITSSLATPQLQVVDTVGAGDSFTAAFVTAILQNKPLAEAHRRAVELATYVCTKNGAMTVLENLSFQ